jgi:hypothetical protein
MQNIVKDDEIRKMVRKGYAGVVGQGGCGCGPATAEDIVLLSPLPDFIMRN